MPEDAPPMTASIDGPAEAIDQTSSIELQSIPLAVTQDTSSSQSSGTISQSYTSTTGIRERHPRNSSPSDRGESPNPLERIAQQFIGSPLMGVLSALGCFIGNLTLEAHFSEQNTTWQSLEGVSALYGPGPFYIWLLLVNTIMFDVSTYNRKSPTTISPWFDKGRLAAVLCYGIMAVLEHIIRSCLGQFTPAQAAARYVGDKAFESTGIIFAIAEWREFLSRRAGVLPNTETTASQRQYRYWQPQIFFLAFFLGRALEVHATRYGIPEMSPEYKISWQAWIPHMYKPVTLAVGIAFGLLTSKGSLKDRFAEGMIKIVWMSNVLCHSGIFGTLGPLRLTNKDPRDREHWITFLVAVIGVVWQYWREVVRFPKAVWKGFGNTYKWRTE